MQNINNLQATTKKVFDECAHLYLEEDKHWGCDLDIISEYVENFEKTDVIEIGTGYAWHLANLFFKSSKKLNRVVGIDYSENMIKRAKFLLRSIKYNSNTLDKKIELYVQDIVDEIKFKNEIFDVALILNNTLGNIPGATIDGAKNQQKKCLTNIKNLLKPKGYLIASVYNAAKLTEEDRYGKVFELDHRNSNLDNFDLVVRFKETNTPYYSHWFTIEEISKLLYDVSFRIVEVEERRKRIVVVAQKKNI